ncbi:Ankyrin repeat-containing domain protein [Metarhizium brunneum]
MHHQRDGEVDTLQLTFAFSESHTGTCSGLHFAISLVRQVLTARPQLFRHTSPLCQALLDDDSISEENLWVLLRSLLEHLQTAAILIAISNIDGSESSGICIMSKLLALSAVVSGLIKAVITDEGHEWPDECYEGRHHVVELAKDPAMLDATKKAVRDRIQHMVRGASSWEEWGQEIEARLTWPPLAYSWATTKVEIIKTAEVRSTKTAVKRHLERIPSMPEYYHIMFKKIDPIHRTWLEASCFWIMFSTRPLARRELATAVAFHEHTEDATHLLDRCVSCDIVRDINRFAGPLVQLVDGKVEAIHKKMKRYVTNEHRGDIFVHRILLSKSITYITLVYSSIRTKEQTGDENSTPIPDTLHCRFLSHACVDWPNHFNMAKLDDTESGTLDKIWEFLRNPNLVAF